MFGELDRSMFLVAPFTGAWIETKIEQMEKRIGEVAPFTGAWIETHQKDYHAALVQGRALHGRVD